MFDGNGLAVSEARGVGVTDTVEVPPGASSVSVTEGKDVFVGMAVPTKVGGAGVDVRVQANELNIHKIKNNGLRFIRKINSPTGIIYPNDWKGTRI